MYLVRPCQTYGEQILFRPSDRNRFFHQRATSLVHKGKENDNVVQSICIGQRDAQINRMFAKPSSKSAESCASAKIGAIEQLISRPRRRAVEKSCARISGGRLVSVSRDYARSPIRPTSRLQYLLTGMKSPDSERRMLYR
jgi:hypothetical protein